MMRRHILFLVIFAILTVSCVPGMASTTGMMIDDQLLPTPTVVAEPTPTPEPEYYAIETLASRTYGEGELNIEYLWERKEDFARYYITYTSDGLNIHGFVNIPYGSGPFPVVVALHGYIPPSEYETLDYSTRYADSIARQGYIVLHPNLRNFPPSDTAVRRRDFLTGYTTDVMNLLALVEDQVGQADSIFENADMDTLGIWGHSLGGGIALRVATLVDEIKGIVLYGAVTQRYNYDPIGYPVYDLTAIEAPFSIHHGSQDDTVSPRWSEMICDTLNELGKEHECYFYEDQPHTFLRLGAGDALFIERTVDFFARTLKGN